MHVKDRWRYFTPPFKFIRSANVAVWKPPPVEAKTTSKPAHLPGFGKNVWMSDSCILLSPSSCRDSPCSMLQSCRVATLSMVSPITSFKSVSSSLHRNTRHREIKQLVRYAFGINQSSTIQTVFIFTYAVRFTLLRFHAVHLKSKM